MKMSEELHEMLAFALENDAGITPARARSIAAHFADLEEFLQAPRLFFMRGFKSVTGKATLNITDDDIDNIQRLQNSPCLDPDTPVRDNYLACIGRHFTRKQLTMIRSLTLPDLIPNPFLISSLGLRTPEEVMRVNVYWRAGRSVVTSMGSFVEDLLLASSATVHDVPTGWDIRKVDQTGQEHLIQVKSGPNDMDADQIRYWAGKIADLERKAESKRGYIGITYGTRDLDTVTLGLLERYLPDSKMKTLIGAELWDFVGDDPHFHQQLCDILRQAAYHVLQKASFADEIEIRVQAIVDEFIDNYGPGEQGVANYIAAIL